MKIKDVAKILTINFRYMHGVQITMANWAQVPSFRNPLTLK